MSWQAGELMVQSAKFKIQEELAFQFKSKFREKLSAPIGSHWIEKIFTAGKVSFVVLVRSAMGSALLN